MITDNESEYFEQNSLRSKKLVLKKLLNTKHYQPEARETPEEHNQSSGQSKGVIKSLKM